MPWLFFTSSTYRLCVLGSSPITTAAVYPAVAGSKPATICRPSMPLARTPGIPGFMAPAIREPFTHPRTSSVENTSMSPTCSCWYTRLQVRGATRARFFFKRVPSHFGNRPSSSASASRVPGSGWLLLGHSVFQSAGSSANSRTAGMDRYDHGESSSG